jgi:hypothetical protein
MLGVYGWMTYGSPVINNNMSRSRNYCFTWNNYPEGAADTLMSLPGIKFLIGGYETAPETGTPHIQGFVIFKDQKTIRSVIELLPGCHIELCKGTATQNVDYCSKMGTTFSSGIPPKSQKDCGDDGKRYWENVLSLAKENRIDEIEARVQISHYSTLLKIRNAARPCPEDVSDLSLNRWIHGPSGCGKSRGARQEFPGAYIKDPKTRWWDGYEDQKVVIVDDLDKYDKACAGDLKRWIDHYAFPAQFKGSSKMIRPERVIITSNYTIEEIWGDDAVTCECLNRRLTVVDMTELIPCVLDGTPVLIDKEFNKIRK